MTEPSRTIPHLWGRWQQRREVPNPAWLKWRRQVAQVWMREVADLAGVSVSFVQTVEEGRRTCPERLRAVYEALQTDGVSASR